LLSFFFEEERIALFSRLRSQFRSNWIFVCSSTIFILLFALIGIYYTLSLLDYLVGFEFPTSNV